MPPACAAITVGFCKEIARQVKRMPASTCAYSTTPAAPLRANRVNKAVFMIFIISTVCCQGDDSDIDMHLKFIDIFLSYTYNNNNNKVFSSILKSFIAAS